MPTAAQALVEALKRLPKAWGILDKTFDGPPECDPVGWGKGAEEVYFAFSKKMDSFEDRDRKSYELGMRACENATRLATNVAVGRGSPTVDCEDITWAIAIAERSFGAGCGGVDKYMKEYFEFPKLCDRLAEAIRTAPDQWLSDYIIARRFGRNQRFGTEIERAKAQLIRERRIALHVHHPASGGPASPGYKWIGEEGER